LNKIYLYWRM